LIKLETLYSLIRSEMFWQARHFSHLLILIMARENHINFNEGRPVQCHDLCEMVFDQLARIEDPDVRSKLRVETAAINDTLLSMESTSSRGNSVSGTDVMHILGQFEGLVTEIDQLIKNSSNNRHGLEIIRQYPADIWKTYVLKMPIS
jgi:hypothetical protein